MLPTSRAWLNTLRVGLLMSAIGWGISFTFTFESWADASDELYAMGAGTIAYRPLLDYWLKMASAVFGCIGVASAIACVRPRPFAGLIGLLAPFHLFIGITLSVAAYRNRLTPSLHPTFIPDITFCFLVAGLIGIPLLHTWKAARKGRGQSLHSHE
ncbi:hypothetical protein ACXR0O_16840 [Verrucomicrobiota bacterium sgz303538]